MGDVLEIDVKQLMNRIRESIGQRTRAGEDPTHENHASPFDDGQATADFGSLHSGYDIRNVSFVSHRPLVGPLVVAVKKTLRKLLTPILDRQVAYNIAIIRVTAHIKEWIGTLDRRQTQAILTVNKEMETIGRSLTQLRDKTSDAQGELRQDILALESQLRGELTTRTEELRAAQAQIREDVLGTQAQIREDVLGTQAGLREELATVREELLAAQARLREELAALTQALRAAQAQIHEDVLPVHARLWEELATQAQAFQGLRRSGATVKERISGTERKLRRILHALETDWPRSQAPETKPGEPRPTFHLPGLKPEFDYAAFEDRFRGDEEDIKERQRPYVQYFEGRHNIIDIGCGRGEFLELLRESGIEGHGVDLDLDMVLLCRDKGLQVAMDDAFAHLEGLPDASIGGVFAAQIIEHLHPRRVIELVQLCHRKLADGGSLILETPNPKCLMVFADSFYRDLSHLQPIHPDTMQFLLEATGFHDVEVKFLAPVDPAVRIPLLDVAGAEQFNRGIERLNSLLFGFQDYAVIGRRGPTGARHGVVVSESAS